METTLTTTTSHINTCPCAACEAPRLRDAASAGFMAWDREGGQEHASIPLWDMIQSDMVEAPWAFLSTLQIEARKRRTGDPLELAAVLGIVAFRETYRAAGGNPNL